MAIKINYSKKLQVKFSNLVLFVDEKYNTNKLEKFISEKEFNYINDLLKTSDHKKICLFRS